MKLYSLVAFVGMMASAAAMAANVGAAPGVHVLSQDTQATFTTSAPNACAGITFPTTIAAAPNGLNPSASNAVEIDFTNPNLPAQCQTLYTNGSTGNGSYCLVGLSTIPQTHTATLSATGRNCQTSSDGQAVILP